MEPYMQRFLVEIQKILGGLVERRGLRVSEDFVFAGLDVAYRGEEAWGAAVAWSPRPPRKLGEAVKKGRTLFEYVPGLLYAREAPIMLDVLASLEPRPDVLIVDGHGLAHPRRAGLASILGLLTGIPSVGVAKRILVGRVEWRDGGIGVLINNGEEVGYAYKTSSGSALYISIGHLVELETLRELMELFDYRYPEPLLLADRIARSASG